jgi:hypothetical protein
LNGNADLDEPVPVGFRASVKLFLLNDGLRDYELGMANLLLMDLDA